MDTARRGRRGGGVAHVLLAVALALPVALVAVGLVTAIGADGQSGLNVLLLALLAVVFGVVAVWAALLPDVRPVEVATARTLLGVALPDVATAAAWPSRRRGAAWLGVLVVVGLVVATVVLFAVPLGVGFVAQPWSRATTVDLPGGLGTLRSGGTATAGLVVAGLALLAFAAATVPAAAWVLARWAPALLGPSAADRAVHAESRERDLARRNALAREVHDALGHSLTAMTLQAGAARRLLRTDPDRADRALVAVEELGRQAQADVDAVVGALREHAGADAAGPTDLRETLTPLLVGSPVTVELTAPAGIVVDAARARVVYRTVQEALTNAARHGTGTATVTIVPGRDVVEIEVANPVTATAVVTAAATRDAAAAPGADRQGIAGLRERLLLAGGEVTTRAEAGSWILTARVPR